MKKILFFLLINFLFQSTQAMQPTQLSSLEQSLIQVKTKLHNLSGSLTTLHTQQQGTTKLDKWILPQKPDLKKEYAKAYITDRLKKEGNILDLKDQTVSDMAALNPRYLPKLFFNTATNLHEAVFFQNLQKKPKKHIRVLEKDNKKYFKLIDDENKKEYHCGRFELLSIEELRQATKDYSKINPEGTRGSFHVRDALVDNSNPGDTTMNDWRKWQVDIGALQAHPDFFDAVFQVSSNFNGLETIGGVKKLSEHSIGSYYDSTSQGPAASLSAIYGALLRRYFPFYDENKKPNKWGQTDTDYINFLEDLQTENKVMVGPLGYATITATTNPTVEDLKKVKIGFHEGVQVFYGARSKAKFITLKDKPTQIINQVFTSALDFRPSSGNDLNKEAHEAWGKMLVTAAYEGTLRAAAMQGKKKVVLTLVGAGLFANPKRWIVDALKGMQDFIQKAGLEVTIIGYGDNDLSGIREDLAQLVEDTNGTYLPESRKPLKQKTSGGKKSTPYPYPNFEELVQKKLLVHRSQFFSDVMGVDENSFRNNFYSNPGEYIRYDKDSKLFFLKKQNLPKGQTLEYQCGRFELHRLEDLRSQTSHISNQKIDESIPAAKRGRINVLHYVRDKDRKGKRFEDWEVDIGANQANPKFSDAVFQVASNYNGLEFGSDSGKLSTHKIWSYTGDPTQGPYASISAAPGTILRYYFPYFDTSKDISAQNPSDWGQRTNRFVNMLEKFTDTEQKQNPNMPMTMTEAGYPRIKPTATLLKYEQLKAQNLDTTKVENELSAELTALQTKIREDYSKEILIGYQDSVQVTHGAMSKPYHIRLPKDHIQIINQVFTAAIDLGQSTNDRLKFSEKGYPILEMWAKEISKAVYEGTIRIAAMKGKTQLILTLVGCGAFNNKFSWVYDAIEQMKHFIINSGLEITIIAWGRNDLGPEVPTFNALVKETNGFMKSAMHGMSWPAKN